MSGLTVRETAIVLDVEPVTVRTWILRGRLHREDNGRISIASVLALDERSEFGMRWDARLRRRAARTCKS